MRFVLSIVFAVLLVTETARAQQQPPECQQTVAEYAVMVANQTMALRAMEKQVKDLQTELAKLKPAAKPEEPKK